MKREDYFLKNVLVDVLRGIGTQFKDKATGKNLSARVYWKDI